MELGHAYAIYEGFLMEIYIEVCLLLTNYSLSW